MWVQFQFKTESVSLDYTLALPCMQHFKHFKQWHCTLQVVHFECVVGVLINGPCIRHNLQGVVVEVRDQWAGSGGGLPVNQTRGTSVQQENMCTLTIKPDCLWIAHCTEWSYVCIGGRTCLALASQLTLQKPRRVILCSQYTIFFIAHFHSILYTSILRAVLNFAHAYTNGSWSVEWNCLM